MIPYSDAFKSALLSPTKELFVKMELYDSSMNYIDEISKQVTKNDVGSISVDRTRPIRRNFNFSLFNDDGQYTWGENSKIWIDKRVKVYTGLKLYDGTIEYIPQGVFILTEPQDTHTPTSKIVTLNGQDKAYLYNDKRGKILNTLTIAAGTPITTAIKTVITGETLFNFDNVTDTVPYDLTYNPTDNIWKCITDLANFAKCDIYYDVNGYLRLRKIDDLNDYQNEATVWSFSIGDMFYAGNVRKFDETQTYNHFVAIGGGTSTQIVRDEIVITDSDPKWAGSPYTIEKIGKITYFHNGGNADPVLVTVSDCHFRNKFSLMSYLGYSETVELSIAPLYILDTSDVIEVDDGENSVSGRYMINKFDIPLKPQLVTVECAKQVNVVSDWSTI